MTEKREITPEVEWTPDKIRSIYNQLAIYAVEDLGRERKELESMLQGKQDLLANLTNPVRNPTPDAEMRKRITRTRRTIETIRKVLEELQTLEKLALSHKRGRTIQAPPLLRTFDKLVPAGSSANHLSQLVDHSLDEEIIVFQSQEEKALLRTLNRMQALVGTIQAFLKKAEKFRSQRGVQDTQDYVRQNLVDELQEENLREQQLFEKYEALRRQHTTLVRAFETTFSPDSPKTPPTARIIQRAKTVSLQPLVQENADFGNLAQQYLERYITAYKLYRENPTGEERSQGKKQFGTPHPNFILLQPPVLPELSKLKEALHKNHEILATDYLQREVQKLQDAIAILGQAIQLREKTVTPPES